MGRTEKRKRVRVVAGDLGGSDVGVLAETLLGVA